jgi:hypothetical protein
VPIKTSLTRINFGCGYDKRDGYLNVDVDPACQPDLLIVNDDYSAIPTNSFEEILAKDVLEHIPRTNTAGALLDWASYLTLGGILHVQTSSILGVAERMHADPSFASQLGWSTCLFGNQAHPGDFHYTGFTETTLRVHLLAAGFDVGAFTLDDGWLLSVDATLASSWQQIVDDSESLNVDDYVTALYEFAFQREPDRDGQAYLLEKLGARRLGARRLSRLAAARYLMSSPERLFRTAQRFGL